ncbi:unnamed protein product [Rotaria sordida]|uniref:Uncharacterized protein n=1 Tax=Rotaria sordida TaxID=392033 RepID=A0A820BMX7_9BILA|nr:unnamed protein product [Rotaria sordida]
MSIILCCCHDDPDWLSTRCCQHHTSDGPECGYAIAVHAHIDKAACTSPVEVGKKIQEAATKSNLKCVTLERGQ